MGDTLPPVTIIKTETHTTAYYRNKVDRNKVGTIMVRENPMLGPF